MNPRVSVVIPAFNAETTIADTVRAVMAQPLPRETFECIVVDDGSQDRTAEIAERAGALVVRLPGNQGPSAARNAGIERAQGEWIAFTDADCVPSRRWLTAFLAALASEALDYHQLLIDLEREWFLARGGVAAGRDGASRAGGMARGAVALSPGRGGPKLGSPSMSGERYDTIGTGYGRVRVPDPRIAALIEDALGDAASEMAT